MNFIKILFCSLLVCCSSYLSARIRIFCTAALINEDFQTRKNEYIQCFNILKSYGYANPYIVEAITQAGPTFLDNFSTHVFYTQVNNPLLRNKGVNEGKSMLEALKYFNFDPDDMIIKVTGRYHLTSDQLIRMVENNPDIDGFVKNDDGPHSIITGCFALRCHYLIDMLKQTDYDHIEKNMICIEWEMADYIKKIITEKQAKIHFLDTLYLSAHVWGNPGYRPGTLYW